MSRFVGTTSRGIRLPIIKQGDNLSDIVVNSVLEASQNEPFNINDRDVIAITESIVARSQGNYATVDDIATDVHNKFSGGTVGVIFPILSRNRFAILLRGMARGLDKIVLMLSYPSDEVGNALLTYDVTLVASLLASFVFLPSPSLLYIGSSHGSKSDSLISQTQAKHMLMKVVPQLFTSGTSLNACSICLMVKPHY